MNERFKSNLIETEKAQSQSEIEKVNFDSETMKYVLNTIEQEKLKHSFETIDPESVEFITDHYSKYPNNEEEHAQEYRYTTTIDDKLYEFSIFVIENSAPDRETQHTGRIDFKADGSEFITNIGLEKIHKADNLIKDLFRFIYLKNRASHLIVEASKMDNTLPASKEEAILQIKKKVEQLKKLPFETFNLEPFYFSFNLENLNSLSVIGNEVQITYTDGTSKSITPSDFLDLLDSEKILQSPSLRSDIANLLSRFGPDGDKKQQQRLNLYERRLRKIGFEIERKGNKIYAKTTNELLENLYGFASSQKEIQNITQKYILETGNHDISLSNIKEWLDSQFSQKEKEGRRRGGGRRAVF